MESNERLRGIITVPRREYRSWCQANASISDTMSPSDTRGGLAPADHEPSKPSTDRPLQKTCTHLPSDLILEILSNVTDSQATLYAASLVCRQWLQCVAALLYRHAKISSTYRWASFILTLTRRTKLFPYSHFIHSVDLSLGKSIGTLKDPEFYRRLTEQDGAQPVIASATPHTLTAIHRTEEASLVLQDKTFPRAMASIVLSTSSLIQLAHCCSRLSSINLSFTTLLFDSMIAETGEYLSSLRHHTIRSDMTHIKIPIEAAIQAIGKECTLLEEVKIQRCEWVTAHTIWLWTQCCPNLSRLDARYSSKCTVKRLVASALEAQDAKDDGTSDMESRSSESSLMDRATVNGFTIDTNDEEDEEDEDDDEVEGDINRYPHYFYSHGARYDVMEPALALSSINAGRRSLEWSDDGLTTLDDDNRLLTTRRRPPSPHASPSVPYTGLPRTTSYRTLQEVVHDILRDAKELGAMDLNWLQDI